MADNLKDIALNIRVATSGADQVNALAKQLDALAKGGGAAAPEFERLANELRAIGQQDKAAATFAELEASVKQTSEAFTQARATAAALDGALQVQTGATAQFREQQAQARTAVQETATQIRAVTAELRTLRAETDSAGKDTASYKTQVGTLTAQLASLKNQQDEQKASLKATNEETKLSERALASAANAYNSAASSAEKLRIEFAKQSAELREVQAALSGLGVSAGTAAEAQAQIAAAMEATRTQAVQAIEALDQLKTMQDAVGASNTRNVGLARAAAQARAEAAAQAVLAAQEEQRAQEAAALAFRLAAQEEQAESDRLAQIVIDNRKAMEQAAVQELAAERAAARESAELATRYKAEQAERAAAAREAQAAAVQAAQQAQEAISQAFGTIGVRSVQQIEGELAQVRAAMVTIRDTSGATGAALAQAMSTGEARVQALERELRAATGQLTLMDRAAGVFNSTIGQFAAGALVANAIQALVQQVADLGREAVIANVDLQKLELGLKAVYGSSEATAKQIEFLRNAAQGAGVSVGEIGGAFVKFAASAQAANIPMSTTNGLFSALTKSAATLGLSGDKVADMLNALGQMASKGVVQMEELRGQLGDALPGALPKVAKGLGITTLEMEKLARNGELLASEVFPALQRVLEETGGKVDTISARWARFKNVMTETAQDLGEGAIGQAFGAFAAGTGRVLEHLAFTAALIGEGFTTMGQRIGVATADIVNQGVKFRGFSDQARAAFKAIDEEADTRMTRLAARIGGVTSNASQEFAKMGDAADKAGKDMVIVGDKIEYVDRKVGAATPVLHDHANAHQGVADAAIKHAEAQAKAGVAASSAGQTAAVASETWTKLTVAYGKANDVLTQQVKVAKEALDAKKAEGAASLSLAQLSGNETQARTAAASAAHENALAQAVLTAALDSQLDVLRKQRDAEAALYNATELKTEAQRKAIVDLNKDIELKAEELKKSQEIATALRNEAAARQLAADTSKDNSERLAELREAYLKLTEAAQRANAVAGENTVLTARAADADRAAAVAAALYKDALADQAQKIAETARAKNAKLTLDEQAIRLSIEEAKTAEAVAQATGDARGAAEAANRVRQLEIDLLRLQAAAQRAEAEAILAALPAKRAQLELEGKLTEAMRLSLQAEELSAQAKLKQAEITDELASRQIKLGQVINAAGSAALNSVGGFDGMSGSMDRASSSAGRLAQSVTQALGAYQSLADFQQRGGHGDTYTEGGTTYSKNSAGQLGSNGPMPGYEISASENHLYDFLHGNGQLSESDRAYIESNYQAAKANYDTMTTGTNSIWYSPEGAASTKQKYLEAKRAKEALDQQSGSGGSGGAGFAAPIPYAGNPAGNTSHTVNIMLGGTSTSINTASEADSQALVGLLSQLGSASQRAMLL
jgi:tape measure domain-containing protein